MANRPSPPDDAEIAAIFERLRGEVAARPSADGPPGGAASPRTDASLSAARDQAERYWAVTADRPYLYKPGAWGRATRGSLLVPLKAVLRRLMRWYVEPAFAQQRGFNSQVLRALDELSERIDAAQRAARGNGPRAPDGDRANGARSAEPSSLGHAETVAH